MDVGKEDEVANEDYYDYSYDSDDMDYLMRKQDEKEFIYNSSNSLHASRVSNWLHYSGLLSSVIDPGITRLL